MKKRDIFLIIGIVLAALIIFAALYMGNNGVRGNVVKIMSNDEEFAVLPLNEDTEISVNGHNTVKIENGEAYVVEADCPKKLCMHQGRISDETKVLVCLPNKMTVSIEKR